MSIDKLDIKGLYKHGPKCMLSELSTIELLYVGYNLVVYRYTDRKVEKSISKDYWLEYAHRVDKD